jgi:hypothetical protein
MLIYPTIKMSPLLGLQGSGGGLGYLTAVSELKIGDEYEGGYFAGYISQNANGVATHGLIVSPKASGSNGGSSLKWMSVDQDYWFGGTFSSYDGAANTAYLAGLTHPDAIFPAADYCAGLSIGGYSDWYLPARYEYTIAYWNLKPSTANNNTGYGANSYAVPQTSNFPSNSDPSQTSISAFQSGGSEDFAATRYWTSEKYGSGTDSNAYFLTFEDGRIDWFPMWNGQYRVRAFRKFAV